MTMTKFAIQAPNACVFCDYNNPSTVLECDKCKGLTIPTRSINGKKRKWLVYSFGTVVSASQRTNAAFFPNAMEALDMRDSIAILIGDSKQVALIVRHPKKGKMYSYTEGDGDVFTEQWDERNGENQDKVSRIVEEISNGERKGAGK